MFGGATSARVFNPQPREMAAVSASSCAQVHLDAAVVEVVAMRGLTARSARRSTTLNFPFAPPHRFPTFARR